MNSEAEIVARFVGLAGTPAVVTASDVLTAFTVDGCAPCCVLFPSTAEDLSRCVAAADAAGLALIPAGNGTQLHIGHAPQRYDVALSTRRLRRIVAHEAADMTVSVEAGLTLAELNAALAAAGQRLPLDPPYPEHTTIGALIATDACGPLRLSQGKVRDLLIGVTVVLADGSVVKGGGRVVKNVAGYDLMKLFTGSFGTLGIVTEATFKIRPCPEREAVLRMSVPGISEAIDAALAVLDAPVAPSCVDALNPVAAAQVGLDPTRAAVIVGCSGTAEEVDAQLAELRTRFASYAPHIATADGAQLGTAIRDLPAAGKLGCKLSVLPSRLADLLRRIEDETTRHGMQAAVLAHVGSGVATIRCAEIAANGAASAWADELRAAARRVDGWVVFDRVPTELKHGIDPWGAETHGLALMRGIKGTLDPHGRLSPGRFIGGI